jgi:hypothetical protein
MSSTLATDCGKLIDKRVKQHVDQCTASAIEDFLMSIGLEEHIPEIAKWLDRMVPRPIKPVAKSTDSKSAWLGYAKKYRLEHDKPSPKDVGDAWKIAKPNLSKEEFDALVVLGQTKSKPKPRKASGSAWLGYRAEWAEKNNALPEGHQDKKAKRDHTSFAAKDWGKGVGVPENEMIRYRKLAEDNKQAKLDTKADAEKAAEQKKKEAKKGKAKPTLKMVEESDVDSEEPSDDEVIDCD